MRAIMTIFTSYPAPCFLNSLHTSFRAIGPWGLGRLGHNSTGTSPAQHVHPCTGKRLATRSYVHADIYECISLINIVLIQRPSFKRQTHTPTHWDADHPSDSSRETKPIVFVWSRLVSRDQLRARLSGTNVEATAASAGGGETVMSICK